MKKEDCIFCKIANGDIPSKTLYEDEDFRVILDLGPATKGHALILPKEHADNLYELPDETASKVFVLAKKLAMKMKEKLNCDGLNIVQNNGEAAGQTVQHFHMHLIPRYVNDGQKILWTPGESTPEELEEVRRTITEKHGESMRTVDVSVLTQNISEMCIEANHYLSEDMKTAFTEAQNREQAPLGRQILSQLQENMEIAEKDMIPICQDTGMAVVFLKVGQDVHFVGGNVEDAVNEGVRRGYVDGYLRKSVVRDPIYRENTRDNTPAIIHYSIIPGDRITVTVAPKGFGSENMSRVFMLKPADGIEGVKNAILTAVKDAGPNACPPMVVGVGIGGTFEKCALLAKEALTRPIDKHSEIPYVKELEEEMLEKINRTGIGPGGLGGTTTALAVNINTYATHIAGLPVAVNICCHVNRHAVREI